MKNKALWFAGVAVGAWWLWCTTSSKEHEPAILGEDVSAQVEPEVVESSPVQARVERPHLTARAQASTPDEPALRVDFDRRPWNPKKELDNVYERRAKIIAGFDRFREETGISQDRADALMMILYDYQETERMLKQKLNKGGPYRDPRIFEYHLRIQSQDSLLVTYEAYDTVEEMLSPDEMRAWRRNLEHALVWHMLSIQPMIGPVESLGE